MTTATGTVVMGSAATATGTAVTAKGSAARATAAATGPATVSGGTATHDADHPARQRRWRAPLGAARRPAYRHRVTARGALGGGRHLGRVWAPRDEDPDHAGATHYLEHLLFKGTSKRTALEISAAMDAVGGELNAFTGKEYTCYYAPGARRGPAAGDRRPVRHGDRLADRAEGRGRRAWRDPRRDRDERGRAFRHRARGVRGAALRRHPARPADPRHRGLDQRDHQGADRRALCRQVHTAGPGGRRRRQR